MTVTLLRRVLVSVTFLNCYIETITHAMHFDLSVNVVFVVAAVVCVLRRAFFFFCRTVGGIFPKVKCLMYNLSICECNDNDLWP